MKRISILTLVAILYTCTISVIGYGHDYCFHYYAADRLLQGESPYGLAASIALAHTCEAVSDGAGFAYPLPFLLIITPLAWLPFVPSAIIWTLVGALLMMLAWLLVPESPKLVLVAVLFLPCYQAVSLGQSTLHWFGLAVLLMLSIERRWWFVAGCCMTILPWKPQAGLVFALAGCWWAWKSEHRALLVMAIGTLGLLTLAWVVRPHWVYEWLDQIMVYSNIVALRNYAIFAPVLVGACWKLPWWTKVAAIQALLFPVGNPYMVIPFLLIWLQLGGWPALIGSSLSYLWPLLPNDIRWFALIGPVCIAAAYTSWVRPHLPRR